MILSSISIALKNAAWTAATALPMGFAVSYMPTALSMDALFWGCVGGLCRPLALKEKWQLWPASIVVGGCSAIGLNGSKLPWLSDYISTSTGPQFQPFVIGVCGIVIMGTFYDIAKKTRAKFGGQE